VEDPVTYIITLLPVSLLSAVAAVAAAAAAAALCLCLNHVSYVETSCNCSQALDLHCRMDVSVQKKTFGTLKPLPLCASCI